MGYAIGVLWINPETEEVTPSEETIDLCTVYEGGA